MPSYLLLFVLMVMVITMMIGVMLGKVKPYGWATFTAMVGVIWASVIDAKLKFVAYVWKPGIDTILGRRELDMYGIGSAYIVIMMIFIVLLAFVNSMMSWRKEGVIQPVR